MYKNTSFIGNETFCENLPDRLRKESSNHDYTKNSSNPEKEYNE
jgi:hypothetical protein